MISEIDITIQQNTPHEIPKVRFLSKVRQRGYA